MSAWPRLSLFFAAPAGWSSFATTTVVQPVPSWAIRGWLPRAAAPG